MKQKSPLRKRWRPIAAYAVVFVAVSLMLCNLVTDAWVTRYDETAPRDPVSGYLEGMTPRTLGPDDATRAVLFVHGFVGAQSNFNTVPDAAAARGWHVKTMRLPGHGTSPRDFEQTTAEELIAGVHAEIEALNRQFETVVVVAHSLGGALSILAVSEEPVDGLVLCAPYFGLRYNRILGISTDWLIRRAALFIRWVPGRPGNGPVADPEGRKHIDCYGWIPLAGALTALEVKKRVNQPEVLGSLRIPVLAIHSTGDTVTSQPATARAVEKMVHAPVKTYWLERPDHVLFWDYEKEAVQERIIEFIEEIAHHDPD